MSTSAIRVFDPKDVTITWGTHLISGFAEEKISISYQDDAFDLAIGCDGEASRVRKNNNSATMTVTLQQTSPSNDFLSLMALADRVSSLGILPFTLIDYSGQTKCFAPSAYLTKTPDMSLSNTNQTIQWVFITDNLGWHIGSNMENPIGPQAAVSVQELAKRDMRPPAGARGQTFPNPFS